VLVVGAVAAATAGAMAALSLVGRGWLAVVVLVAQVALVVGWTFLLDIPGSAGAVAIAAGAAASSDGVLLKAHHVSLRDFATIVAFAFLLALLWQIARPGRTRVTESLAATLAAAVLAVAGGAWLTLYAGGTGDKPLPAGHQGCLAALLGVTVALGLGRLVDVLWSGPRLAASSRRGWLGLVVGVAAGCAVGAWYGGQAGPPSGASGAVTYAGRELMSGGKGALIALVAAGVAAVVDVGIDAGMTTLAGDRPDGASRRPAPWPARLVVLAVLPILAAAPAAYVVARVVLT
jgi:hypothetical protein